MISKFKLLRRLLTLTLFLGVMANTKQVFATHYGAVDLSVTYIGSGPTDLRYEITLEVYKACEPGGAPLSNTYPVNYRSVAGAFSDAVTVIDNDPTHPANPTGSGDTLDQLCEGLPVENSCRVPTSQFPGFVRKIYTATVTLPS